MRSISWVNLHLRAGPLSTHLDAEKGCSAKNAFDSLFIYLNWSAVIKSSVSHYSFLERSRASAFAKIFEWLGPRHGPCQSNGKHSLCLLDSLKCCCKSWLPVRAARPGFSWRRLQCQCTGSLRTSRGRGLCCSLLLFVFACLFIHKMLFRPVLDWTLAWTIINPSTELQKSELIHQVKSNRQQLEMILVWK